MNNYNKLAINKQHTNCAYVSDSEKSTSSSANSSFSNRISDDDKLASDKSQITDIDGENDSV